MSTRKQWVIIVVIIVAGIFYYVNSSQNRSSESAYQNKNSEQNKSSESASQQNSGGSIFPSTNSSVWEWHSQSPQRLLDENNANNDMNNIRAMQKEGWKLFVQNGQPVNHNAQVSGRIQILEQSANDLMNGCYELDIDSDGNIVDMKLSENAKNLYEQKLQQVQNQQIQQAEQQQQVAHNGQISIIQNNISDIHRFTDKGYRIKITDASTATSWNVKDKTDNSPNLEYSIGRLKSFGIAIHTDNNGKVIGFGFDQTEYKPSEFNLYGMNQ